MEIEKVLHMKGGLGETSYASNSLVQKKVISMTKPIIEEAITELYTKMAPKSICLADFGCSSGPNTFFVMTELLKTVDELRRKMGRPQSPEFHICLNDLPGNDFNSIFRSLLPSFRAELRREMEPGFGHFFVSAVPGSFYGRLLPAGSVHFVHSSYSLMWLSKVPKGVEMNKENISMASNTPRNVINAYYDQFRRDFSNFLECRAEEVVAGGKMVLTILGRKSDDPSSKDGWYIWELLAIAIQQMVSKGLIDEEKLHSFHIPQYAPSAKEVAILVEKEGSFGINRLEVSEITWAACGEGFCSLDSAQSGSVGHNVARCMRSVAEPLLVEHFGDSVIDRLFDEYEEILSHRMSKEDTKFINVSVCMTRKE